MNDYEWLLFNGIYTIVFKLYITRRVVQLFQRLRNQRRILIGFSNGHFLSMCNPGRQIKRNGTDVVV